MVVCGYNDQKLDKAFKKSSEIMFFDYTEQRESVKDQQLLVCPSRELVFF